jgi:Family of unknown function (DUF6428)
MIEIRIAHMSRQANCCPPLADATLSGTGEASAAALLAALVPHRDKALIFVYDGREVLPGYHVTEVKAATFASLDCGANPETWRETIIQLWDVPGEAGARFMPVKKFLAIMGKVTAAVDFDRDARLSLEISDGRSAMQIFAPAAIEVASDAVRVALQPRPASCKPRDRWLEQQSPSPVKISAAANELDACCS